MDIHGLDDYVHYVLCIDVCIQYTQHAGFVVTVRVHDDIYMFKNHAL